MLLSVGELIPRKNHEVVLRALSILKQMDELDGIQYVICGRGALEQELKSLTAELGLTEQVHFLGYRKDIPAICAACDLFVFMSHQEGLPVALMEAMACGLPVVCSAIRGNTDLIETGVTGLLAEKTPQSVAAAIQKMRDTPELREQAAAAARKTVKEFDLGVVKARMKMIYEAAGAAE